MKVVSSLLGAALLGTSALAAGYKESKSGDLPDNGLEPKRIVLKLGDNIIDADFGGTDLDYFRIRIPEGQQLASIMLDPRTIIGRNASFVGVQKGRKVTVDPYAPTADELLGWTHFTSGDADHDILPAICNGAGAEGCTPPLGPGHYAFWVQEAALCDCHYRFVFTVTTATD